MKARQRIAPPDAGAESESAARAAALARRARDLAREEVVRDPRELVECLVFDLASQDYAVDIAHIREVHPLKGLTPIPCAPDFVLGIIAVRGQVFPVLDLQRLLGVPEQRLANATRAIILHDQIMEFGIVADAIRGVRRLTTELAAWPATMSGSESTFVRGATRDRIVLLDAPAILAHSGFIVNEEVET